MQKAALGAVPTIYWRSIRTAPKTIKDNDFITRSQPARQTLDENGFAYTAGGMDQPASRRSKLRDKIIKLNSMDDRTCVGKSLRRRQEVALIPQSEHGK